MERLLRCRYPSLTDTFPTVAAALTMIEGTP